MSLKMHQIAELVSGHISTISSLTALEEAMILPDLHAGWKLIFDQFHIHIDTLCAKNDTLQLPFDVVRNVRSAVTLDAAGTNRSYRMRVIQIAQKLLHLADVTVPDRLKEQPPLTTDSIDFWDEYDASRQRYAQYDAFFDAGGYGYGAPSKLYREWIEDIRITQARWKLILERLIFCLERGEFFHDAIGLPDEPPLTRRTRKKELKRALALHGLRLRKESRMCARYINHGGDIDRVVEIMKEQHFLFTFTDYKAMLLDHYDAIEDCDYEYHVTRKMKEECKRWATRTYIQQNPTELDRIPSSLFLRLNSAGLMP